MGRRVLLAFLVIFAVGTVGAPAAAFREMPVAGPRVGPLELRDVAGRRVSLAELRGKVVVLNFWATWCQPCVEELPLLVQLARRYGERGFVVVAASIDEESKRDELARLASRFPASMQVWVGATMEDMARLEVAGSLPATLLIDRDGAVHYRRHGALTPGDLDARIDELLRESTPPRRPFQAEQAKGGTGTGFPRKAGQAPVFRSRRCVSAGCKGGGKPEPVPMPRARACSGSACA